MTKRLLLMRHARADSSIPGDPPLSEAGRSSHRSAMRALKESGLHLDALFSSPLRRAVETAEIAAEYFGLELQLLPELAGDDIDALQRCAEALPEDSTTLWVGHAPTLTELARRLGCVVAEPLAPGQFLVVTEGIDFS